MQSSSSTPAIKNIVDNPYCTCGDIEDTHHFLFVCHQYTDLIVLQISRLSEESTGQIFATSSVIYQMKMWGL